MIYPHQGGIAEWSLHGQVVLSTFHIRWWSLDHGRRKSSLQRREAIPSPSLRHLRHSYPTAMYGKWDSTTAPIRNQEAESNLLPKSNHKDINHLNGHIYPRRSTELNRLHPTYKPKYSHRSVCSTSNSGTRSPRNQSAEQLRHMSNPPLQGPGTWTTATEYPRHPLDRGVSTALGWSPWTRTGQQL